MHNAIHLALGLIGLVSSFSASSARWYLWISGVVCIALAVYGWSIPKGTSTNVIPVNGADNWLHLATGLAILAAAMLVVLAEGRGYARARRQP